MDSILEGKETREERARQALLEKIEQDKALETATAEAFRREMEKTLREKAVEEVRKLISFLTETGIKWSLLVFFFSTVAVTVPLTFNKLEVWFSTYPQPLSFDSAAILLGIALVFLIRKKYYSFLGTHNHSSHRNALQKETKEWLRMEKRIHAAAKLRHFLKEYDYDRSITAICLFMNITFLSLLLLFCGKMAVYISYLWLEYDVSSLILKWIYG